VRRSPLLPIFLIVVVDVLGLTIILPLLPFYAERLGASPAAVGALVSTYAACQLVAGPLLGRLSDRTGRKPLLLVSQIGTFIGFLVLAGANTLWLVFLSRAIDGITAGNLSLAQAYIADVTEPQDRAKSFGYIGIAFGIGFLFGPALSGFLSQFGLHWPILAAAALSATSVLCTATLLPSTPPHRAHREEPAPAAPGGERLTLLDWKSYAVYFKKPELAPFLWQFFCFTFAFATFTSGFALFAERQIRFDGHLFGAREVGYTFAYSGLVGGILQGPFLGRLVRRFGEPRLVSFAWIASTLGYVLLGFTTAVPMLVLAATVSAVGHALVRPTLTSLITQHVSRREQGVVLGLNQSLTSVSQIVAPLLGGFLIQHGQLLPWALVAAGVAFAAWVIERRTASKPAVAQS
jgi:MFS family permease